MRRKILCPGVVALCLLGNSTFAETPKTPVSPSPQRQIIRWPGGWMYLDEPGVIYRDESGPKTGSTTVIVGSANGIGNKITVDNGKASGTTVLQNVRNGIGNSVKVSPTGPVYETKPEKTPATPDKK